MEKFVLNLNEDDLKKSLRVMVSEAGLDSLAALGRELGYKETTFRSAVNNNSIRMKDFVKAADLMGFEVSVRKKQ
jgi:hypothetical protein